MTASPPLALFTDLDGCLLNKHDYDFAPALLVLERLQRLEIPVILSSSKTEAEMRPLSVELHRTNGTQNDHAACASFSR